ncbi:MAG TPA: type IV secretory system conjugative DNA transfer family protein [Candidatus Kryptobacter bacterium]|nr:type IV secretory system conjugative DNA transfer family protein [Candidatus Kryptobacter bacterium]
MATNELYHIPRAQGDMTKIVWPSFGLFLMIVLLSLWGATEYSAWALGWNPVLGKPIFGASVYEPWDVLIWTWKYNSPAYGMPVMNIFEKAHIVMGGGGLAALLIPVGYAFMRTRKASGEKNDLHGSAHWADDEEVSKTKLLPDDSNRGGVYFGAYANNKGKTAYLRHKGPEHMMVFAPTRSGKGVGIVIPTLLSWDQSVLVHDIKGENWHLTSGFRKKILGQRVIKFDPTSLDSARFNPLSEIRQGTEFETRDVQNIATMIVDPDGRGLNDHWAKTGFDLLVGVILHVLYAESDKSLARVQSLLTEPPPFTFPADGAKPKTGIQTVMERIRDTQHLGDRPHPVAQQSAQSFLNKAPNEASGVLSTALSFLSLYKDDIVAANTRVSDFTIESLMQEKTSLYLVVPPSDKDRLKPLTRLIINQVTRRLTEEMGFNDDGSGKSRYEHRLLLLLDEFPSLGKLDIFQEALAFIAGYGLKAMLIVQDLSQLYAAYGKDESIISNCHIRIAFAPNKIETAELLSKMSGQATVTHAQRQYSGNRLAVVLQHVNTNEQIVQRPLLTPDEAMRLPAGDEIVFVAGHAPIYCQKIKYYADPAFSERVKIGPPKDTGRG